MTNCIGPGSRRVRALLSSDWPDCRRRVLNLYRAWYRQVPYIKHEYDIPVTHDQVRAKIREEFLRHKDVTDIRQIDMLVIKGHFDLRSTLMLVRPKANLMYLFMETVEKKPTDFLSKFLDGHDD